MSSASQLLLSESAKNVLTTLQAGDYRAADEGKVVAIAIGIGVTVRTQILPVPVQGVEVTSRVRHRLENTLGTHSKVIVASLVSAA